MTYLVWNVEGGLTIQKRAWLVEECRKYEHQLLVLVESGHRPVSIPGYDLVQIDPGHRGAMVLVRKGLKVKEIKAVTASSPSKGCGGIVVVSNYTIGYVYLRTGDEHDDDSIDIIDQILSLGAEVVAGDYNMKEGSRRYSAIRNQLLRKGLVRMNGQECTFKGKGYAEPATLDYVYSDCRIHVDVLESAPSDHCALVAKWSASLKWERREIRPILLEERHLQFDGSAEDMYTESVWRIRLSAGTKKIPVESRLKHGWADTIPKTGLLNRAHTLAIAAPTWCKHLAKIYEHKDRRRWVDPVIADLNFDQDDILKAWLNLSTRKAVGPDGLSPRTIIFFKNESSSEATDIEEGEDVRRKELWSRWLLTLFTKITSEGKIPRKLNRSLLWPIHKKGNPNITDNYRTISVQNSILKLFHNLINQKLTTDIDYLNTIPPSQYGFVRGRGVLGQICRTEVILRQRSKARIAHGGLFLDLQKAFDSVPRDKLLLEMYMKIADKNLVNLCRITLVEVMHRVINVDMRWMWCDKGVVQGSPLGPSLFLMVTSNLKTQEDCEHIRMFADDILIVIKSHTQTLKLWDDINKWVRSWEMTLNIGEDKTTMMIFKGSAELVRNSALLPVPLVEEYKYLGRVLTIRKGRLVWREGKAHFLRRLKILNTTLTSIKPRVDKTLIRFGGLKERLKAIYRGNLYALTYLDTSFMGMMQYRYDKLIKAARKTTKIAYGCSQSTSNQWVTENLIIDPGREIAVLHLNLLRELLQMKTEQALDPTIFPIWNTARQVYKENKVNGYVPDLNQNWIDSLKEALSIDKIRRTLDDEHSTAYVRLIKAMGRQKSTYKYLTKWEVCKCQEALTGLHHKDCFGDEDYWKLLKEGDKEAHYLLFNN